MLTPLLEIKTVNMIAWGRWNLWVIKIIITSTIFIVIIFRVMAKVIHNNKSWTFSSFSLLFYSDKLVYLLCYANGSPWDPWCLKHRNPSKDLKLPLLKWQIVYSGLTKSKMFFLPCWQIQLESKAQQAQSGNNEFIVRLIKNYWHALFSSSSSKQELGNKNVSNKWPFRSPKWKWPFDISSNEIQMQCEKKKWITQHIGLIHFRNEGLAHIKVKELFPNHSNQNSW